jgi:hypothetical protein
MFFGTTSIGETMSLRGAAMQRVAEMRAQITAEINDLERRLQEAKIKLAVLNDLMGTDAGDPAGARRRNTKRTVLSIVTDADRNGVTPTEVVERAKAMMNKDLKLTSVQSLLSKAKAAGTLTFNGERYYVAGKEPPPVPPLRAVQ